MAWRLRFLIQCPDEGVNDGLNGSCYRALGDALCSDCDQKWRHLFCLFRLAVFTPQ